MNRNVSSKLFLLIFFAFNFAISKAQIGKIDSLYYGNMGLNGPVLGGLVQPDSSIIVYGQFASSNERVVNYLAKLKQDGTNDYSFNTGSGASGNASSIDAVARQADGKLVVGGAFTTFNGTSVKEIVRLNTNGSIDTSFHNGTGFNSTIYGIYVQPSGAIVVAGVFSNYNGATVGGIVRLTTSGARDTSFHSGTGANSGIGSMVVQNDGKILIGGAFSKYNGITDSGIARLNSDGSVDTTFSSLTGPGIGKAVNAIALTPGGKILVGGNFTTWGGRTVNYIARLNSNGRADTTFSGGTGFNYFVYSIIPQADSKFLVCGGFTTYKGVATNYLVRIDSSGTKDSGFNTGYGPNGTVNTVFLNYDGKIFAGGSFSIADSFARHNLVRVQTSGAVDQSFFYNSKLSADVKAIVTQSNGKVILAGSFTRYNDISVGGIIRLNTDGSLDTSFHSGAGANGRIYALAVTTGDKILVGGMFTKFNGNTANGMFRLNSDGSYDNTFASNTVTTNSSFCFAQDKSGRIYVGGYFSSVNGVLHRNVARFSANGTLDNTFSPQFNNGSGGVYAVTIQSDGKIIVGGSFGTCNNVVVHGLARIDSSGNIDTATFRIGTGPGGGTSTATTSVNLQPNGKILIGSPFMGSFNGTTRQFTARLKSDGSLDSSFVANIGGGYGCNSIQYYNGGVLIGGGYMPTINGIGTSNIAQVDTNGNVNTSFVYYNGLGVGCIYLDTINGRILGGGGGTTSNGQVTSCFIGLLSTPTGVAIDTVSILSPVCASGTTKASFKNEKNFNNGNIFTVQLSDSSGSFASPVSIGTQTAYGSGWDSINVTIPSGAIRGVHYKIRIKTTNPVYTSAPSGYFPIGPLLDTLTAGGPTTFCNGNNVVLTSKTAGIYAWSNGGTSQSLTATASGTYTVTATANNCSATASKAVTVNTNPTATASNSGPYCSYGTISLTGGSSGLISYSWSGPNSFSSATQNPTRSANSNGGTYTISVTDANGCTATASTTVTVNVAPTATASNTGPYCSYGTISLSGGSGSMSSYAWSGPNSYTATMQSPTLSASGNAGVYSLTVTDGNGCTSSASTTVAVNAAPTATASNSGPYCSYGTISLTGGTSGLTSYSWSGPNSFTSATRNSTLAASGSAGNYSTTVTDGNGCTASASTSVVVNNAPSATASNTGPYCSYDTITLSGGISGLVSYSWSGPNSFSSTSQNPTRAASNNGGTYTLTVTDSNGCTASSSTNVTVPNLAPPVSPSAQWAFGNSTGIISFNNVYAEGTSGNQIEWSLNTDFSGYTIGSSPSNIVISVAPGSAQIVWVRSRDSVSGCVSNIISTIARITPLANQSEILVSDSSNYLRCGSNILKQSISQSDTAYYDSIMALDNSVIHAIASGSSIDTSQQFVIPVVVHVITPTGTAVGNGSNISYAQIQSQINKLNASFGASYLSYNGGNNHPSAVNTHVSFVLAQNTSPSTLTWPNNAEPGVFRYYTSDTLALDPSVDSVTGYSHLVGLTHPDTSRFPFNQYLNIWVVPQIQSKTVHKSILGFATYPYKQGIKPVIDGMVIMAQAFGDNSVPNNNYNLIKGANQGNVAVQQAGHYLGLYHIFEPNDPYLGISGYCSGSSESDCNLSGDFCCDTKKCATEFASGSVNNSCTSAADYPVSNFMNYLDDRFESAFTLGQVLRMNRVLTTTGSIRKNLWSSSNISATGVSVPNCILSAEIDYGYNGASAGTPNPLFFRTPSNCATSWQWSFPGAAYVSSSTNQYPIAFSNSPGNYNVFLKEQDADGNVVRNMTSVFVPSSIIDASITSVNNSVPKGSKQPVQISINGGLPPYLVELYDNGKLLEAIHAYGAVSNYFVQVDSTDTIIIHRVNGQSNVRREGRAIYRSFPLGQGCNVNEVTDGDFSNISHDFISDLTESSYGDQFQETPGEYEIYDPSHSPGPGSWFVFPSLQSQGNSLCIDGSDVAQHPNATVPYTSLWQQSNITIEHCTDYQLTLEVTSAVGNAALEYVLYASGNLTTPVYTSAPISIPTYTGGTENIIWNQIIFPVWSSGNTNIASADYTLAVWQVSDFGSAGFDYCIDNISYKSSNCSGIQPKDYSICASNPQQVQIGWPDPSPLSNCPTCTVTWTANGNFVSSSNAPFVEPTATTVYTATITGLPCGTVQVQETVFYDAYTYPNQNYSVCPGGSVTIGWGSNPLTQYTWSRSVTGLDDYFSASPTANPLVTTNYVVTVTTACGEVTATCTVTVDNLSVNNNALGNCSFPMSLGSAISVSGGNPSYGYSWAVPAGQNGNILSGSNTSSPSVDLPGDYSVTVTDMNNCSVSTDVIVNNNGNLVSNLISAFNSCSSSSCNGSLTLELTPTTLNYTYLWSNSQTSSSIGQLCAGTYSVSVFYNDNQCSTTLSGTVGTLTVAATASANCSNLNSGTASAAPLGGTPPYTYLWDNGATTQTITNLNSGNYAVTVTDAVSCTSTANCNIIPDPSLNLTITSHTDCYDPFSPSFVQFTATAHASGGTAPISYVWSDPQFTTPSLHEYYPGVYSVTITDGVNCSAVQAVTFTQDNSLTVTGVVTGNGCVNGNYNTGAIDLSVTGGVPPYSYLWGNGATTASITGLQSGIYTVDVTDQNHPCGTVVQFSVQGLTLSTDVTNVDCYGNNNGSIMVGVFGNPPLTFVWSSNPGGPFTPTYPNNPTNLSPGIYNLTVTDVTGCSATAIDQVTQPNAPLSASMDITNPTCANQGTGSISLTVTGGTPAYSYVWGATLDGSFYETTQNIGDLSGDVYHVTVTDANSCTFTTNGEVNSPAPIFPHLPPGAICADGGVVDINLTVTNGALPLTYLWSNNATTQNLSSVGPGIYVVTITDFVGCTASSSASVYQLTIDIAPIGFNCISGYPNSLQASVSGGITPYSYVWSNGSTTATINDNTNTYMLTVTDHNGCTGTATSTINKVDPFAATAVAGSVNCSSSSNMGNINLTVSGGSQPYAYSWTGGATTQNPSGLPFGNYTVTVTDNNGCTVTASTVIDQSGGITLTSQVKNYYCQHTGSVTLGVNGGTQPYTYMWSNGETTNPATNLLITSYFVTVTDANGCSATALSKVGDGGFPVSIQATGTVVDACNSAAQNIILTATSMYDPDVSYVWSDAQTGSSISGSATGSYIVTATYYNCSTTTTYTIASGGACCRGDLDPNNPGQTLTYSNTANPYLVFLPAFTPGTSVALNGSFEVNAASAANNLNATFNDITFLMGSNSKITVHSGQTLNLNGCTFQACDIMWDGIYVEAGGTINVIDDPATSDHPTAFASIIRDAMNGIVFSNASTTKMLVSNTYFYCNQRSIQINGNGLPMIAGNYNISNCYFGMGNRITPMPYADMKQPPSGPNYTHPLFGIGVDWTFNQKYAVGYTSNSGFSSSNFDIPNAHFYGQPNTFDNMNCGIKATNSAVYIYLNTFEHIRAYDNVVDASLGCSVYSSSVFTRRHSFLNGNLGVSVAGIPARHPNWPNITTTPAVPVLFNNCDSGVSAKGMFVNVTNTSMTNVLTGVWTTNCQWPVTVSNNIITSTKKGITLNSNTAIQNVHGNIIAVIDPLTGYYNPIPNKPLVFAYPDAYGIKETYIILGASNIILNQISGGRNGIISNNSNGTVMYLNTISNSTAASVCGFTSGIYASGCKNISMQGNKVYGTGTTYDEQLLNFTHTPFPSAIRKNGIYLSGTPSGKICDNTLDATATAGIGHGMSFLGDCHLLDITNNHLYKSKYGLVMQPLGIAVVLGQQGSPAASQGNQFSGPFASAYSAYALGITVSTFYYFPSAEQYPPSQTSSINNLPCVLLRTANNQAQSCPAPMLNPKPRLRALHNTFDDALVGTEVGSLMQPGFEATAPWLSERRLYSNLSDSSVPTLTVNTLPAGFDTLLTTFIDTATDSNMISIAVDLLGEILSDTASYISVDSSALLDTALASFYTAQASSDFNAIQAYENQFQVTDTSDWQSDPKDSTHLYNDAWNAANSLRAAIPTANVQAHNYKIVQGIYLRLLNANDSLGPDSATLALVLNIALQCPYVAGDAVYSARALYALFADTLFYDDLQLCQLDSGSSERVLMVASPQDTITTNSIKSEFAKLYPNPAKQIVNLAFKAQIMGTAHFEVFDNLGERVIASELKGNEGVMQYSTANISNGVYYWRLSDASRTIKADKLVIMK